MPRENRKYLGIFMKIFAISDLHLSFAAPYDPENPAASPLTKPMDIFDRAWRDYPQHLEENWRALVSPEDVVLLPGDLSWAMTLEEAVYDLDYLGRLPGRKLFIKGNHDYWWQSLRKVQEALPAGMSPIQHSAVPLGDYVVCGTRGWISPGHPDYKESQDKKIYARELLRLEMALKEAAALGLPIIAMLHYPPVLRDDGPTGFTELLERYPVRTCLYGHVHGDSTATFTGTLNGVEYHNCSCDRLAFRPLLVV